MSHPSENDLARALVDLAAEEEYFAPLIAGIPADSPAVHCGTKADDGQASRQITL